jgi:hypothetical protein
MKTRTILLGLAALFVSVLVCFAANGNMGTWKLNEATSKISPGAAKNTSVVVEAAGNSVKVIVDGVDAQGNPTHNEWTGKFDGKDYPITGDTANDTRAYRPLNENTMAITQKKAGKVTTSGRVVISPDGKTRTVTANGTNASGNKISIRSVYDKH